MIKSILIIVPYDEIYPPTNGGMQRCFNIIHQLAKGFDLTVIISQKKENFLLSVHQYPIMEKLKIYSTADLLYPKDIFSILPQKLQKALRYRWYKKKIKGSADGLFLLYYPVLKKVLKEKKFDVVILENLATLNAVSIIRKYDKKAKIIYDAHNVDTNLAAAFLQTRSINKERFSLIRDTESSLHKTVDAVLTCSKKDQVDFSYLNNGKLTIAIIPNGVNLPHNLKDAGVKTDNPLYILFCGFLSSSPNNEGLYWFYTSMWQQIKMEFPDIRMIILGSGNLPSSMSNLLQDKSLIFTGRVDDVTSHYEKSAISIVPLKTGSGTRLKILEAMSFGVPVVSTTQGAEGIDYTDGVDVLIADNENLFAKKVIDLLKDKKQRLYIQQNARQLIEQNYGWDKIGRTLFRFINSELFISRST